MRLFKEEIVFHVTTQYEEVGVDLRSGKETLGPAPPTANEMLGVVIFYFKKINVCVCMCMCVEGFKEVLM